MVGQKFSMVQVLKKMHKNSRSFLRFSSDKSAKNVSRRRIVISPTKNRQIFQYEPLFRNFCFWKFSSPDEGLEPATLRLKVWCSTDWANRACVYQISVGARLCRNWKYINRHCLVIFRFRLHFAVHLLYKSPLFLRKNEKCSLGFKFSLQQDIHPPSSHHMPGLLSR